MTKKVYIVLTLLMIVFMLCSNAWAEETNLLKNGSFDRANDDFPVDWRSDMWVKIDGYTLVESVQGLNGSAIKITSDEPNDAKLVQNIKVKPNKTYRLSGYIKAEGVEEGKGANLSFENMFVGTDGLFDTSGEWQYVEIYGKTQRGQRELSVYARLGGYGGESRGAAYFDDLRFEQVNDVPEGVAVHSLATSKPQKEEADEDENKFKFAKPMVLISVVFILAFLLVARYVYREKQVSAEPAKDKIYQIVSFTCLLVIGLAIRVILAVSIQGYPNDIACWQGWAHKAANFGLFNLYNGDIFIDYPPGYMYVLYLVGLIMRLFSTASENIMWLLVKIPSIITDLLAALLIYKLCKKRLNTNIAIALSLVYFLNPAVLVNSSAWGQIDSVLGLMVILYTLHLYDRKFMGAGIFFAVGVLLKPQMLLFAPLYIVAAYHAIRESRKGGMLKNVFNGVLAGLGAFVVLVLPFAIGKEPLWIINLYLNTLGSYSSLSLNACNIWALFGGMWVDVENTLLGISYKAWGYAGLVVACVIFIIIALKDKKKENLFLHAAILITGIFLFAGKMHERYMYAAMILLLVSYIITGKRSSLWLFGIFSITQFANTSLVLANKYIFSNNPWTIVISLATLLGFVYMIVMAVRGIRGKDEKETPLLINVFTVHSDDEAEKSIISRLSRSYQGLFNSLKGKDYLFMAGLTIVYAVVALFNLGNTDGPQTMWDVKKSNQQIIVDFGSRQEIKKVMYFRGQATSGSIFTIEFADDLISDDWRYNQHVQITSGGQYEGEEKEEKIKELKDMYGVGEGSFNTFFSNYPDIFKWFVLESNETARYARITFEKPMIRLMEMAFVSLEGETIAINSINPLKVDNPDIITNLFDEQHTVPEYGTYQNSTYFDEIYHAGTAFEHLIFEDPYETTHPPLGKVIMSWGIKAFGMTPFGWRIMGTIVGILMVPLMYLLAMMLFRQSFLALVATVLMTFDFMHFVQTRIATIDSYGVFFIMGMYLCMGIYFRMNYNKMPLQKTLWPLLFSGIFFGLGAASKWICLYAGVGLAVIFFYTLYMRYQEYRLVIAGEARGISADTKSHIERTYLRNTFITLGLCVLFFIVIPACIYTLSYIPYLKSGMGKTLSDVWQNQKNMFSYHSGLNDSHPYASPWYEWPLIIKPMWYYYNPSISGTGFMSSIAAFGNPFVWWAGTAAIIWLMVDALRKKHPSKAAVFIIIGFLSQYLPWVLVPRSMFIYHYFASVPFVIMAIVMFIKRMLDKERLKKWHVWAYLGLVIALFALFYPVLSGTTISSAYGKFLKWLPSWWFLY